MDAARRLGPLLLVAVVALGAGMWFSAQAPEPPPLAVTEPAAVSPGEITVHVSGAVTRPGLVSVAGERRVADAIAAAGGAATDADLERLNLAASVADGQQVVVPRRTAAAIGDPPPGPDDHRIRVNVATAEELQRLPGVGPVLAARIVAHREANGPFRAIEDLLDVPGIGEGKLATLREAAAIP